MSLDQRLKASSKSRVPFRPLRDIERIIFAEVPNAHHRRLSRIVRELGPEAVFLPATVRLCPRDREIQMWKIERDDAPPPCQDAGAKFIFVKVAFYLALSGVGDHVRLTVGHFRAKEIEFEAILPAREMSEMFARRQFFVGP